MVRSDNVLVMLRILTWSRAADSYFHYLGDSTREGKAKDNYIGMKNKAGGKVSKRAMWHEHFTTTRENQINNK